MPASTPYVPRDVQQPEAIDLGPGLSGRRGDSGVSALTMQARSGAVAAAQSRMTATDPNLSRTRSRHDKPVPVEELETRGPVSLRGGPPPLHFPVDGNFARQPEPDDMIDQPLPQTMREPGPMQRLEASAFAPYQYADPDPNNFQFVDGSEPLPQSTRGTPYDPVAVAQRMNSSILGSGLNRRSGRLTLAPLTVEDVDQIWDWIRQESDRAKAFFGVYLKSALNLHLHMQHLMKLEAQGQAIVRVMVMENACVGLTVVHPINAKDRVANVHLYIGPPFQHALDTILPALIAEGDTLLPRGMRLAVYGREGWERVLEPLGFVAHTILILER